MGVKTQISKRKKKRKKKIRKTSGNSQGHLKKPLIMPTIFKPPFLKRGFFFFFGLKYFTLNGLMSAVNERMSLIHCGRLLQCKSMPFLYMVNFNLAIITTNVIV